MPIVAGLIIRRLFHAFSTTFRLLGDFDVLRRLPWNYLRRLPLRNPWIGVLTLTLPLTLFASFAAVAIRGATGASLASLAWTVALIGILSSWLRWVVRRFTR